MIRVHNDDCIPSRPPSFSGFSRYPAAFSPRRYIFLPPYSDGASRLPFLSYTPWLKNNTLVLENSLSPSVVLPPFIGRIDGPTVKSSMILSFSRPIAVYKKTPFTLICYISERRSPPFHSFSSTGPFLGDPSLSPFWFCPESSLGLFKPQFRTSLDFLLLLESEVDFPLLWRLSSKRTERKILLAQFSFSD